jgi:hypothetical protein
MPHTSSCEKPLRTLCAAFALLGAVACGAASVDSPSGSETHFLARCSAQCGGGLECIEGVCTVACVQDAECTALNAAAVCEPTTGGGSSCRVSCGSDGECTSQNDGWSCSSAACIGSPALLSSTGPVGGAACPTFAGGVQQPIEVQTTFERVPFAANVEWAYADEGGVYWFDRDGAMFVVAKGATSAFVLRPAPDLPGTRLGLIGSADRLYWTEAAAVEPGPPELGPPPPPGRVMSVSKDGGPVTTLIETPSQVLIPLGVDPSGRVFVTSTDGSVHQVTASGALERVANIPAVAGGGLQMVDGLVYWAEYDDAAEQMPLFVARPGGDAPVRVTPLPSSGSLVPFIAGHGVVLWSTTETRYNPLLLVQHYVMLNQNTGCVQELPSDELSIGGSLLDAHHVYWKSFNALGSSSPGQPATTTPLLRVDLRTGRFERVLTPGFDVTLTTDLLAQDDDTLYIRSSDDRGLLAVRKPR